MRRVSLGPVPDFASYTEWDEDGPVKKREASRLRPATLIEVVDRLTLTRDLTEGHAKSESLVRIESKGDLSR